MAKAVWKRWTDEEIEALKKAYIENGGYICYVELPGRTSYAIVKKFKRIREEGKLWN